PMPQSSFENIKVLNGMSDTDIRQAMTDWTEALGVACSYCHVTGDFASDMNAKKETARKMARMVNTINKDFLDGKAKCVLCHRGAAVPMPKKPPPASESADDDARVPNCPDRKDTGKIGMCRSVEVGRNQREICELECVVHRIRQKERDNHGSSCRFMKSRD